MTSPNVWAELEQLGHARDAGYISDADYEAKKTELLSRV